MDDLRNYMANSTVDSTMVDTTCDFDEVLKTYTLAAYVRSLWHRVQD
jgi:hypothetical protein